MVTHRDAKRDGYTKQEENKMKDIIRLICIIVGTALVIALIIAMNKTWFEFIYNANIPEWVKYLILRK
jgi:hypothetical protein